MEMVTVVTITNVISNRKSNIGSTSLVLVDTLL